MCTLSSSLAMCECVTVWNFWFFIFEKNNAEAKRISLISDWRNFFFSISRFRAQKCDKITHFNLLSIITRPLPIWKRVHICRDSRNFPTQKRNKRKKQIRYSSRGIRPHSLCPPLIRLCTYTTNSTGTKRIPDGATCRRVEEATLWGRSGV